MEMLIDFPGGSRVDAHFSGFTVATDQPPAASAPTPFAVFLASIGTCAGIYVLGFCQQRGLPTDGIRILQRVHASPATGMVDKIDLEIQVPPAFPEKYRELAHPLRRALRGEEASGESPAVQDKHGGRRSCVGLAYNATRWQKPRTSARGFFVCRVDSGDMKRSLRTTLLAAAMLLWLNACTAATASPALPTFTQAAPAPTASASSTPAPLPSPLPAPTRPTAPAGPELDCRLNSQSPIDGTKLEPRTDFTVRWDVTNTGAAAWEPGSVDLIYSGGTRMYFAPAIPLTQTVAPGQSTTLTVDMKALRNTSSYVTTWTLRRGDIYFCTLSVKILVQWYQGLERHW